ncbi:hypothetical protein RJZ56_003861 [Blastomyces dermatitidis]|uniref:DUF7730 domain-containing protein n=1 Tax=Blastomyces gilchristii (strain SLH14081) TaxID=559298 RepID=A0A179UIJ0_BLAGS|nr:uncharacterized protein BDBG_02533 [Blastomyces gilchristii SLH14081]OAT06292.1 hypothetical protein BDBG_02533 [Blastomyces gilchristii SLH14081]
MAKRDRIKRLISLKSTHRWTSQHMRPQATEEAIYKFLSRTPPPDIIIDWPSSTGSTIETTTTTTTRNPHQAVRRSPLFHKLPPELRRHLYILAFGNRVVHIEDSGRDKLTRMPCFCPFSGPGCAPWEDRCDREYGRGLDGLRDPIGIIGWLLSCRMAYAETIGVFYSTNTVRILSFGGLPRLPTRLPPGILGCITSLELIPRVRLHALPEEFLCLLPREIFPGLRRLYLLVRDIEPPLFNFQDYDGECDKAAKLVAFLSRADRIARKLLAHPSRLEVFEVAVRHSTFRHLIAGLGEEERRVAVRGGLRYPQGERLWRSVGELDVDIHAAAEDDVGRVGSRFRKERGYWILDDLSGECE